MNQRSNSVPTRQSVNAVKDLLKRSWFPFFSRFGKLTAVQVDTVPLIMSGVNVVVESPTASGKTEAVVAPVVERLGPITKHELAVIYLVPTRALANDILTRLAGPLEELGLRAIRRHGDSPTIPMRLPHFLITTPESLDSLICRRPDVLRSTKVLIIDEIHLLDNTYRGDQLRVLTGRLKRLLTNNGLSTHLLSATMGNAAAMAERYTEDFKVVSVAGHRPMKLSMVNSPEELVRLAKTQSWRKILCFCNARKQVEALSNTLRDLWRPYPVLAHHGSLGRHERESAEAAMKSARAAICVATSTLEIGIDVGNIDAVCLAQVPPTVGAFLQRLGRGNRRTHQINGVAIVGSENDRLTISRMFENARFGLLEMSDYVPDLSVVVQQIYSLLFQYPSGISEKNLYSFVEPLSDLDDFSLIVSHLAAKGYVETSAGKVFASTRIMDMADLGHIHSNIQDSGERQVIELSSGKPIGTVAGVRDQVFILAGRSWRVIRCDRKSIYVGPYAGKADPAAYLPRSSMGAFFSHLPPGIQSRILESLQLSSG